MQQALLRRQAQRRHTQPVAAMGDFSTAAPTCRLRSADVQDSDAQGNTRPIGENLALGEDAPCMDEHMPAAVPEHRTTAAQPRSLLSHLDTIPRADSNLSAGDGQHLNVFGNHQPEQHEAAAASDYAEGGAGGAAGTNMQPPDDLAGAGKQHHVDAGWRSEAQLSTSERSRPARAATDMTADVSAASAPFPEQARSPHTATEEDAMADASHVESLDQQEDHDGHEDWFAGEDEAMHVWGSDHDAACSALRCAPCCHRFALKKLLLVQGMCAQKCASETKCSWRCLGSMVPFIMEDRSSAYACIACRSHESGQRCVVSRPNVQ